jgi:uncharacterized iron-regulated membrane protein
VDRHSGKVINAQDSGSVAFGARAIILNRAIRRGDVFGYFSTIIVAVSGLTLLSQAVAGFYLWSKKRKTVC